MTEDPDHDKEQQARRGPPPPVDFRLFCDGFAQQAMVLMGKVPDPFSGKELLDLPLARYFIDLLGMLQEKTRGNLTEEERGFLDARLSMLRLTWIDEMKHSREAAEKPAEAPKEEEGPSEAPAPPPDRPTPP